MGLILGYRNYSNQWEMDTRGCTLSGLVILRRINSIHYQAHERMDHKSFVERCKKLLTEHLEHLRIYAPRMFLSNSDNC